MINGKRVLGLIPARGGSKGIKKKNIIDINGIPLMAYTIMEAKKSCYLDSVVVTTDSKEIGAVAVKYGAEVPFLRPKVFALDVSATLEAVLHAIMMLEKQGFKYDILALLQPTSPLRISDDIDQALRLFEDKGEKGLAAVSEVSDSPLLMRKLARDGQMVHLMEHNSTVRRQDMPIIYRINGSIYINLISEVNESLSFNDNPIGYVMEKSHSTDVDDYSDLAMVQYYLEKRK